MIHNGSPMGCGFFIFFNNLDVSPPPSRFKGFRRVELYEDLRTDDDEVLELITVILTSRILDG